MGLVNADSSVILEIWKNIKTAVSSIEATKAAMSRKYIQLGNDWNDKKYRDLGDIVQECGRAFHSISRTLLQAEKPISLLAKSLQQYEETRLGASEADRSSTGSAASSPSAPVISKSKSEKLQDLKLGLATIDQIIENYAESLERRGLQRGPAMDEILEPQRHLLQAELLQNINGDFSNPVPTLTASDFDSIIDTFRRRGWLNHRGTARTARSLTATRYGFTAQSINGTDMIVYNDPVGTNSLLIQRQGNSHYDMGGTCGLCQCSNLLTLAGVEDSSEDFIISTAMHSSDDTLTCLDLFHPDADERGGTTVRGRQEILSRCGLPTYSLPVSYNRRETIQVLSEAVRTGHGVIVSVDVEHLWRNGQSGGHAISLISVSQDGQTFIYNDTGNGTMGTISAHDLGRALTGRPANVTTNIIR